MNRHIVLIFALTGLCHFQLVDSQITPSKTTKNSLKAITSLISGAYPLFEYVQLYADDLPTWQNLADKELKSISVAQYLKSGNWFREMRRNMTFDYQIQQLIAIVRKIETMFDGYVQYKENFNRYAEKNKFSNASYRAYVQNVLSTESDGIADALDEITMIMAQTSSEYSDSSLTSAFFANILKSGKVCETKVSNMQKIGQLLGYLTIVEVKGLLTLLLAYDVKEWLLLQDDFSLNRQLEQAKSLARYNLIVKTFQSTLSGASNELHSCSPDQHVNGLTYFELKGLFQAYIVQEANAAPWLLCGAKCATVSGKQSTQCWDRPAWVPKEIKEVCTKTRRCDGVLKGCKPLPKDESHEYPKVCLSSEANSSRRYDFATYGKNDNRKCDKELPQLSDFVLRNKKILIATCVYCQCTCVRDDKKEKKYRFSLQPSLVEYEKDYVVTGARLKKTDDNLIYIQIQQGQLLPHGGIDPGSIEWINPPLKNISTQEISWEFRRINLDNLNVPIGHVVVGVTFKKNSVGPSKYFELQVMHLPYNTIAGSLFKDDKPQITIANNTKQSIYRKELRLSNKEVPTHFHGEEYHSPDNHYLLFQPTDLMKDGGQSTIPFIDAQELNFKVPTPLSGVGLSYRGNEKSGGYLDLKLFSYNLTYDLLEKKSRKKRW